MEDMEKTVQLDSFKDFIDRVDSHLERVKVSIDLYQANNTDEPLLSFNLLEEG